MHLRSNKFCRIKIVQAYTVSVTRYPLDPSDQIFFIVTRIKFPFAGLVNSPDDTSTQYARSIGSIQKEGAESEF